MSQGKLGGSSTGGQSNQGGNNDVMSFLFGPSWNTGGYNQPQQQYGQPQQQYGQPQQPTGGSNDIFGLMNNIRQPVINQPQQSSLTNVFGASMNNLMNYNNPAPQQQYNQPAPQQQYNQPAPNQGGIMGTVNNLLGPVQNTLNQQRAPMQQPVQQRAPMQQPVQQRAPMQQPVQQQAPMQQPVQQRAPTSSGNSAMANQMLKTFGGGMFAGGGNKFTTQPSEEQMGPTNEELGYQPVAPEEQFNVPPSEEQMGPTYGELGYQPENDPTQYTGGENYGGWYSTTPVESPSFETPSWGSNFEMPSWEMPSWEMPSFEMPTFDPGSFDTGGWDFGGDW